MKYVANSVTNSETQKAFLTFNDTETVNLKWKITHTSHLKMARFLRTLTTL